MASDPPQDHQHVEIFTTKTCPYCQRSDSVMVSRLVRSMSGISVGAYSLPPIVGSHLIVGTTLGLFNVSSPPAADKYAFYKPCSLVCSFEHPRHLGLTTIPQSGGSMQSVPLPRQPSIIPLKCPVHECEASAVHLLARSGTVATFRCGTCHFAWSARIDWLPLLVRQQLDALRSPY